MHKPTYEDLVAENKKLKASNRQLLNTNNYERGFFAPYITRSKLTKRWQIMRNYRRASDNKQQWLDPDNCIWVDTPMDIVSYDDALELLAMMIPKWAIPNEMRVLQKENVQLAQQYEGLLDSVRKARIEGSHPEAFREAMDLINRIIRIASNEPDAVALQELCSCASKVEGFILDFTALAIKAPIEPTPAASAQQEPSQALKDLVHDFMATQLEAIEGFQALLGKH